MDNATRSEQTRAAVLKAALTIIGRDGPGQLTMDALARESGISKGGIMHQYRTKEAVLKALLEYQIEYFGAFSRQYIAGPGVGQPQPQLKAELMTAQEAVNKRDSVALAVLAAVAQDPTLLSIPRAMDAEKAAAIAAEADDPDLALLRWSAARGLMITAMLGQCPFSAADRERLFARLLDDRQWGTAKPAKSRAGKTAKSAEPAAS